jgi:GTPase
MPKEYCGYISIIGKPNVGKSTILNAIFRKKSLYHFQENLKLQEIIFFGVKTF